MNRWALTKNPDYAARFHRGEKIGVILIQQESNSFAVRPTSLGEFTIRHGSEAASTLSNANSEFTGALREISRRGGIGVPILHAHALPGGVLNDDDFARLSDIALTALRECSHLDGLVVCLHGAMATATESSADAVLLERISEAAKVPVALSLDLHANCTPRLCAPAVVVTGYKTNPHVDLASTGARAAALLCAVMGESFVPTMAMATRPVIFPDETLRIENGLLGDILDQCLVNVDPAVVDVNVFPTQPWLDAAGVGFTALVTANDDISVAQLLATSIADAVYARREEFVVERIASAVECLRTAINSSSRPSIVAESADAPTAGGSGDSPAMLHALASLNVPDDLIILATIVDRHVVNECHRIGANEHLSALIGASIDHRYHQPFKLEGEVLTVGDGEYQLSGVGYEGLTVSMGRFAVVRSGALRLLVTERASWSADPSTWRFAGLEPNSADVLIVRSCSDYIANFPVAASTATVADVDGPCTPRLSRLRFRVADPAPWPASQAN